MFEIEEMVLLLEWILGFGESSQKPQILVS